MKSKSKIVSYVLAALSGVCFVSGIAVLSIEGSAADNGVCKKTNIDA
jgi:hypothetical protein